MSMSGWGSTLAVPIQAGRDHIRGPVDAPVSLVEYGDYECPYCSAAHEVVDELVARMGDELQFAYRQFPLTTVHPHALGAAEAAEAAGAQGGFWPMHDRLFRDQAHLAVPDLIARADLLGLDVVRFTDDLARHVHVPRIQDDVLGGVHSGVQGTPTFFVDGVRYDGPPDVAHLLAALQPAHGRTR
jgi:protein-disulfide isomerase